MTAAELDRFAMWSVTVCGDPSFLALRESDWIDQALSSDQTLECSEPMFVVMGTIVSVTAFSSHL